MAEREPKTVGANRTSVVSVRFTEDELGMLKGAAEQLGIPISALIRDSVLSGAQAVLDMSSGYGANESSTAVVGTYGDGEAASFEVFGGESQLNEAYSGPDDAGVLILG